MSPEDPNRLILGFEPACESNYTSARRQPLATKVICQGSRCRDPRSARPGICDWRPWFPYGLFGQGEMPQARRIRRKTGP
jgi:hypothetical protein